MTSNKISLLFLVCASFIFIHSTNKTSGGHPSSTGAPGEKTCARTDCHADAAVSFDSPANSFTFSEPSATYQTGKTYQIQLDLNVQDVKKFGFQIVAIDSATQKNAGTWQLTEPTRTQIINGETPNTQRRYITHTTAGSAAVTTGKGSWKFNWKAPAVSAGTILFYYATNAANANDQATGDHLYLSSFKIRHSLTGNLKQPEPKAKPDVLVSDGRIRILPGTAAAYSLEISDLYGRTIHQKSNLYGIYELSKDDLVSRSQVFIYRISTAGETYSGKIWN